MNKVQTLHREAMDLADQAETSRLGGDSSSADAFLRQAFEKERAAALEISEQEDLEPTRSVLLRSAASLALECQELQESERLVALALSGHPPAEIARELETLHRKIQSAALEQLFRLLQESERLATLALSGQAKFARELKTLVRRIQSAAL